MILRHLAPALRSAAGDLLAGIGLLAFAAILELLYPWPIKGLVDYVLGGQPAPAWLQSVWPPFAARDASGMVAGICLAIALLAAVHQALQLASRYLVIRGGNRTVCELRGTVSDHLHRLGLTYHDRTKVGESIYRVAHDTQGAMALLAQGLAPAAAGVLMLAGVLALLLRLDWLLTLCAVVIAPAFWFLIRAFGRRIALCSQAYHENESSLVADLQESLSSIRAVQAFGREPEASLRLGRRAGRSLDANQRLVWTQLWFGAAVGLAMAMGTAAVVGIGAHRVLAGHLTVGDVLVFLGYLTMLYQPMNTLSQSATAIATARTQLGRVAEVLDREPEIRDLPGSVAPPVTRGAVTFRRVRFAYEPARPVLFDVDFEVEPDRVVAVVGETGAGKSTLASLLLRFHDPTAGAVLLDGRDLRDLPTRWLRQQVSVVLQDTVLFSTSVADNIRYARPDATRAEIEFAARNAQAHEFVRELPEGYDTLLGERGVNLSVGQRQRLAIARAFLKNSPILVLDEPTSALDAETEQALIDALHLLVRGRTTFLITHRLSSLRLADWVLVLERGRVVERGSQRELLEHGIVFRRLWELQGMGATPPPRVSCPSGAVQTRSISARERR